MKAPTHYFVNTGHSTQTKNKLQEEFFAYLKSTEGTLVKTKDLKKLKNEIINKASELNEKYKRCHPLKISFWDVFTKHEYSIQGFPFLTYKLLPAYESN